MRIGKRVTIIVLLALCLVVFTGCMAGRDVFSPEQPAGFFQGLWHGWIAPFVLIARLCGVQAGIYEVYNVGLVYDIGFYIAIISGFGTIALFRRRH